MTYLIIGDQALTTSWDPSLLGKNGAQTADAVLSHLLLALIATGNTHHKTNNDTRPVVTGKAREIHVVTEWKVAAEGVASGQHLDTLVDLEVQKEIFELPGKVGEVFGTRKRGLALDGEKVLNKHRLRVSFTRQGKYVRSRYGPNRSQPYWQ